MRISAKDMVGFSYAKFTPNSKTIVSRYHVIEMDTHFSTAKLCPGMPQEGEQHVAFPECTVVDISPRPANATDQCYVDVTWQTPQSSGGGTVPGEVTLAYGTSVTQRQTQVNWTFHPLQTTWNPTDKNLTKPIVNTATGTIFWPRRSIVATGTVSGFPDNSLFKYTGYTNEGAWQGGAARTWLYLGCEAETHDNGKTHSIRLSFLYDVLQWDQVFTHRDEYGQIPKNTADAAESYVLPMNKIKDPDKVNGVTREQMYPTCDFEKVLKVKFTTKAT